MLSPSPAWDAGRFGVDARASHWMQPESGGTTRVTLRQLGWKSTADYDLAVKHYSQGWAEALQRLQKRFAEGPIDWPAEAMIWQERQKKQ